MARNCHPEPRGEDSEGELGLGGHDPVPECAELVDPVGLDGARGSNPSQPVGSPISFSTNLQFSAGAQSRL